MQLFVRGWVVVLGAALLFGACGDDEDDGGTLTLEVGATIAPDPPQVGQNTLTLLVQDGAGNAVTGAVLTVVPWMATMGHGSNEDPVVTETGGGDYEANPVTFTMAGPWEVRVNVETADGEDDFVFNYDVPAP